MKKVFIGLLIFTVLAVITNPREAKHKEAVKRELDAVLAQEFGKAGEFISGTFSFKGKTMGSFIKRKNKYIFSETILKIGEEETVIGYGFFGFVIINRSALKT